MLSDEERRFMERVSLIAALDHSGRAGNGFFLTLFDQHPEVLTCPWMHYTYSYLITALGEDAYIDPEKAAGYWPHNSYFRFAYCELSEEISRVLVKFGGDPSAALDRSIVRETFGRLLHSSPRLTRKELVLFTYMAFARGAGRDLKGISHILVSDAVSLRSENPLNGFSGRIIAAIRSDFPDARIIGLVRDPRATFASCRHQFVNANGNMYGYRPGNALSALANLAKARLTPSDCAFLYWILYFAAAARTIFRIRTESQGRFMFVRNEDLNLDFQPTLLRICSWLGIGMAPEWLVPGYAPTMVGSRWRGTGAYNNRYQDKHDGPLKNDSDDVAQTVTGPNAYVTQRWRKRLAPREIRILQFLFREEMEYFGYPAHPPRTAPQAAPAIAKDILLPFLGELPSIGWIALGAKSGTGEMLKRIFYSLTFPPFYLVSRLVLLRLAFAGRFFGLRGCHTGESCK